MQKKLYKIEEGKKLAGVCGGIAEYFNIDPTIVRLAWVLFSLCFGCGLIAYIVAAIIMPNKSDVEYCLPLFAQILPLTLKTSKPGFECKLPIKYFLWSLPHETHH